MQSGIKPRVQTIASSSLESRSLQDLLSRTPHLNNLNSRELRAHIKNYFTSTFDTYESLFDCIAVDEGFYRKPISLRHPLIFYFGHTATFFSNKLLLSRLFNERINKNFESMFAVGVDEMSWDDLNDENYNWPSVAEVRAYRAEVRKAVINVIESTPLNGAISWESPWWSILMGIEHERIHLETSSVLIRQQSIELVCASKNWQACSISTAAPTNSLQPVTSGIVQLGKTRADAFYGWDNEYGSHTDNVNAFEASKYLVSNQEFLAFVEAGGYTTTEYWEEEGQGWLGFSQAQHPTFWIKHADTWYLRLMTEEVPMKWSWPAEVNYHEAKAFCNWKAKEISKPVRLPTEDEWYRLYDFCGVNETRAERATANIHLDYWASSCPVDLFAQGDFYDVVGNVWQWTETPIYPFNGFEVHPIYDDFTTPTFDGRHNLIKGGSWISTGNESLKAARYAFRKHFFQHAGFRYIVSGDIKPVPSSHYETDKLMSEYAEFHYGDEYFKVPNFSKALVDFAMPYFSQGAMGSALDLGCASGRASFELAQYFERVTGIDFSARFISQCVQMAEEKTLRYTLVDEGELVSYKSRSLSELGLDALKGQLDFYQGDACNLKPQFTQFDFILAANLIDRLYSPRKFLSQIHERINIGGLLMLASPYTWLEEHTPRDEWIGAYKKDGENYTTLDGLNEILRTHFRLVSNVQEIPFVIRETKRKHQHTLSEVTIWQRIN